MRGRESYVTAHRVARNGRTCAFSAKREVNNSDGASPVEVRVLFVEDDSAVAQMYKLKLELDGYQVEVAADG